MDQAKVIHRRDVIREVRDRWLEQYKDYPDAQVVGWSKDGRTTGQIRKALAALDLETCSPADVDVALGTGGWARNECDECDGDFEIVLQLGEEPGHDNRWWNICHGCLTKASALLAITT